MDQNIRQNIADNIADLRKGNHLTQSELAEKICYSDKSVSKWERAEALPDVEVLCRLAEVFDVSLDYFVRVHGDDERKQTVAASKRASNNKLTISLMAILVVWIVATVFYVYRFLISGTFHWLLFVWAVPCSAVIGIVFNSIWGKRKYIFLLVSILVWSLLASAFLQFLRFHIWPLFFLGVPAQISIILWSKLKTGK